MTVEHDLHIAKAEALEEAAKTLDYSGDDYIRRETETGYASWLMARAKYEREAAAAALKPEPVPVFEGSIMLRATLTITYAAPLEAYASDDPKVVAAVDAANFEADPAVINFLMEDGDSRFCVVPVPADSDEVSSDV